MRYIILLFLSALLAAGGQLMLKLGAVAGAQTVRDFVNLKVFLGLSFYFLGMLIWIYCLSRVPLSLVYAFTALTFFLVYLLAWMFLGEQLHPLSAFGLALIFAGFACVVIGQSGHA